MITRLQIKNYAIIEQLEIQFSDKLTIITGETGAGKSILLGALGLIMGRRADTKSLFNETKKCVVEGVFEVRDYDLKKFFSENDIDYDDEVIVRREITPSGKSRAFINDTPVTIKLLQQLSGNLIDLHQQFDTLDIHSVSFQMRMVDALAGNGDILYQYKQIFNQYQSNKKELEELLRRSQESANEIDFIEFQLGEFNEAELVEGEQEQLESEQQTLSSAEDIKRVLGACFQGLNEGEMPIIAQLQELLQAGNAIRKVSPNIEALFSKLEGLTYEIEDVASTMEDLAEQTDYDPERIQEIQQRLDLIYKLENKHRVNSVEELLSIQEALESQLTGFGDLSSDIQRLEKEIDQQEEKLGKLAQTLRVARLKVAPKFEEKVQAQLRQLGMEYALLKIEVAPLNEFTATGLDAVQFLFAPNKGSRFEAIKNVASGGEIARLTLCIKSLVASAIPLPTLIFDEIDTGVSGDVALKMGHILRKLSNQHQVVSITHTPQIAVNADAHYFVYKQVDGERTVTNLKLLEKKERIQEIATMLSGSPPSKAAIDNAKALLKA